MNADRAVGAPSCAPKRIHSVSNGINWKLPAGLAVGVLLWSTLGTGGYPLLGPDETRYAGIAHDMWAAQRYLVPRVDGMPVLDGAPLYYWVSLSFLFLFGAAEWVARLPSAVAAALTLAFMVKALSPWPWSRSLVTLAVLFLIQPALLAASRFASPDMFNILLHTVAVGSFLQASLRWDDGQRPTPWLVSAWGATAMLGLGAGPLAPAVPLVMVCPWLLLRRRPDLLRALGWGPGLAAVAVLLLPWLWLVAMRFPGIVAAILEKQVLALFGSGRQIWTALLHDVPWSVWALGSLLPLLACLIRYGDARRRRAFHSPVAGLMAVWLVVAMLLHPLLCTTVVGLAAMLTIPLLYFGMLALTPIEPGLRWADARVWLLHVVLVAAVCSVGLRGIDQRASTIPVLVQAIQEGYRPMADKVVLLDRYDYEFNFYMRSPKLVYVASDWAWPGSGSPAPWQEELLAAAQFVPETAQRLLLTHDALLALLCGKRVVNLWIIGAEGASLRHPVLSDLTPVAGTGKVRAWYLDTAARPAYCDRQPPRG